MELKFVVAASFGTRLEAETIGHALDQHGIPFYVQSEDIGFFGTGGLVRSPFGARLMVPSDRLAEVAELLNCVVTPETLAEMEEGETEDSESND